MISRLEVGTVRPVKVAWMGSSRWPRSIRTRSCTLLGAAVVEERVERRADGAAGVEHVVHQDDVAAGDVEADVALGDGGAGAAVERSSR